MLWEYYGNSSGILWAYYGNNMEIIWEDYGNNVGILCISLMGIYYENTMGIA